MDTIKAGIEIDLDDKPNNIVKTLAPDGTERNKESNHEKRKLDVNGGSQTDTSSGKCSPVKPLTESTLNQKRVQTDYKRRRLDVSNGSQHYTLSGTWYMCPSQISHK